MSINWIGFYTLYKKEILRFLNVWIQTVFSPIVTLILFLAVFTVALGLNRNNVLGHEEVWSCAADLYRKAQIGITKTGLLIKAPNTGVPMQSPYLAIANKQAQIMTKAAVEMGFTPASRSRITQPTDTQVDLDPWADIAG